MAMSLVEETIRLVDLDGIMSADSALAEAMTGETETLLRSAHYPVDDGEKGYRRWLEKKAAAAVPKEATA